MGEFIASIQNSRLLDDDARVAQSLGQLFNPDLYPDTGRTLAISQEEVASWWAYRAGASIRRCKTAKSCADPAPLVQPDRRARSRTPVRSAATRLVSAHILSI